MKAEEINPISIIIDNICTEFGVSVERLLFGRGGMKKGEVTEQVQSNLTQVSQETASMLGGMQDKLAFIEAGVTTNRTMLDAGRIATACANCLELYNKLEKANERLYQSAERERKLLKENSELKTELIKQKNKPLFSNGDVKLSNVS